MGQCNPDRLHFADADASGRILAEYVYSASGNPVVKKMPEAEAKKKAYEYMRKKMGLTADNPFTETSKGGTSRNICKGICKPLLEADGLILGGPTFRGRDDKTSYRQFWRK